MFRVILIVFIVGASSLVYADCGGCPSKSKGNQGYVTGQPPKAVCEMKKEETKQSRKANIDIGAGIMKADQWVKDHLW
jgi:hypothetical protein